MLSRAEHEMNFITLGSGVGKLRIELQNFTTPSKKKLEISTISSNYHIDVNPR